MQFQSLQEFSVDLAGDNGHDGGIASRLCVVVVLINLSMTGSRNYPLNTKVSHQLKTDLTEVPRCFLFSKRQTAAHDGALCNVLVSRSRALL